MSEWREAVLRAPGGRVAIRQLGDVAPHDAALGWLFPCLLAGLTGGLLLALVVLSLPGSPVAARRVVLTAATGAGALATVLAAALGRHWAVVAALTVLAGVARDRPPPRWMPPGVVLLGAVLATVEPATALALPGCVAAYAIARLVTRGPHDVVTSLARDRAAPLVATGLILVAAAGLRAAPAASPAPVIRSGASADMTVSLTATAHDITVLAVSGRRPPPAPIDQVTLDLGRGAVPLLPTAIGRYAAEASLPPGSTVRANVTVRRAGERFTVPLSWSVPSLARTSWSSFLTRGGVLALAVLGLAAVHRGRPKRLEVT